MKVLSILVLFSGYLLAHDNVARNCYLDYLRTNTEQIAINECTNVASTCYDRFRRHNSKEASKEICSNVANTCFGEYNMKFNRHTSRDECLNVNNKCYVTHRKHGVGVYESRDICLDNSL